MPVYYVARALDPVSETPGETFRVRILKVCKSVFQYNLDVEARRSKGEKDVVVVTDEVVRKEPRRARQIIVAKVGTGAPGSFRFTTWS